MDYNNLITIICICLIIILFVRYIFIDINRMICDIAPEIFTYDSKNEGPTILIIGATHGNEPAGYHTIKKLMDMLNQKNMILVKGRLILIPVVNYCGFKLNLRNRLGYSDINRNYYENTNSIINKTVIKSVKLSDFILDFHEGWGFHKINNDSIGSTLSPSNTTDSIAIALQMKNNVNNTISNSDEQFLIRTLDQTLLKDTGNYIQSYVTSGTLSKYAEGLNKNYILVETSGQNDIQDLDIRVNQGIIFINTLLLYYGLINNTTRDLSHTTKS